MTVRYWASARARTGVSEDRIPVDGAITLAELKRTVLGLHPDADALLEVCSVLVDDEQVSRRDPETVQVRAGQSVEFLPPFAGG